VEIMGPGNYESVGKSQSVLVMIDPIISTRTRNVRTLEERLPRRRRILVHAIMALPVRARAPCVLLLLELLQEQGSMLLHQRCARSTTRCQSPRRSAGWLVLPTLNKPGEQAFSHGPAFSLALATFSFSKLPFRGRSR
jgi:hypothetical protein